MSYKEIENKFLLRFKRLSNRAIFVLDTLKLNDFSTFYNFFIEQRKMIDFSQLRNCGHATQKELNNLISSILNSVDETNSANVSQQPKYSTNIEKIFDTEFKQLSTRTKNILSNLSANYLSGFNEKVLQNNSVFNLNQLRNCGAKSYSEIVRFQKSIINELYKAQLFEIYFNDAAAKEVSRYAESLKDGFADVRTRKVITHNTIQQIQKHLEGNDAGYRRLSGTALINDFTKETVYIPPQDYETINNLMNNLVEFMNDESMSDLDALTKMAIIHHRFETIHPFYDGNGRTGRIINILYLVKEDLLTLPILYLSRYIIQYKADYYKLLQQVRKDKNWEPWILYMLRGVEETAKQTLYLIEEIKKLMQEYKNRIRKELPKIYSQDLLNNMFKHPYTKIEFLEQDLTVKRKTAAKYLNQLTEANLLQKVKIGVTNFYINKPLYNLFLEGVPSPQKVEPIETITNKQKAAKL